MSNVIQFLEALSSSSSSVNLSAAEYAASVAALDVDEQQRNALLNRDESALSDLLGGRSKLMCIVFPPDGDEQKDDDQRDEEPAKESPPESE